jgi:hypothetical protein
VIALRINRPSERHTLRSRGTDVIEIPSHETCNLTRLGQIGELSAISIYEIYDWLQSRPAGKAAKKCDRAFLPLSMYSRYKRQSISFLFPSILIRYFHHCRLIVTTPLSHNQAQLSDSAFGCFQLEGPTQTKNKVCRKRAKFTPQRRKEVASLRGKTCLRCKLLKLRVGFFVTIYNFSSNSN